MKRWRRYKRGDRTTWVWRKRGIASLESVCKTASYVARGKCV